MERIGADVERELGRLGPGGSIAALVSAWPTAVGADVARNAWPARVARDGTLVVNTSSSAWAFELTQLAPTVLDRLSAVAGEAAPRDLRFVPGPLPEPAAAPPDASSGTAGELSPEVVSMAEEMASTIDDEELRERVARAAALSLERARADRRF